MYKGAASSVALCSGPDSNRRPPGQVLVLYQAELPEQIAVFPAVMAYSLAADPARDVVFWGLSRLLPLCPIRVRTPAPFCLGAPVLCYGRH